MMIMFMSFRQLQGFQGLCASDQGKRPIYIYTFFYYFTELGGMMKGNFGICDITENS